MTIKITTQLSYVENLLHAGPEPSFTCIFSRTFDGLGLTSAFHLMGHGLARFSNLSAVRTRKGTLTLGVQMDPSMASTCASEKRGSPPCVITHDE